MEYCIAPSRIRQSRTIGDRPVTSKLGELADSASSGERNPDAPRFHRVHEPDQFWRPAFQGGRCDANTRCVPNTSPVQGVSKVGILSDVASSIDRQWTRPIMNALRIVFRLWLVIGLGIVILGMPATAQNTPPNDAQPPAPELLKLTGEDDRRAERLDEQINEATKADRWDEAIARARELLALRTQIQGLKHFQTADAEWWLDTLRRLAPMPHEDQVAYESTRSMNEQARTLFAQGKYAQAQPLYEKVLERPMAECGEEPGRDPAPVRFHRAGTRRQQGHQGVSAPRLGRRTGPAR